MTISVKVKPKSSFEKIENINDSEFNIWIHEVPEKGKANMKIRALLSSYFHIPKSKISLKSGQTSRNKIFEVFL